MAIRRSVLCNILVLTIAVTLEACAVLRIDVDVYKGPLANQKQVQLDQAVVMAIAAKPLLIQLRDRLEDDQRAELSEETLRESGIVNRKKLLDGKLPDVIRRLEDEEWYKRRFINVTEIEKLSPKRDAFASPEAYRVNAILSLYDDTSPEVIFQLQKAGLAAIEEYQRVSLPFDSDYSDIILLLKSKSKTDCTTLSDGSSLVCSYIKFLAGLENQTRPIELIGSAYRTLQLHADLECLKQECRTTQLYEYLSDPIEVRKDALFMKLSGDRIDQFTRATNGIAKAFLDRRYALRKIWRLNVQLLNLFDEPKDEDPHTHMSLDASVLLAFHTTRIPILHCAVKKGKPVSIGDVGTAWAKDLEPLFEGTSTINPCDAGTWAQLNKNADYLKIVSRNWNERFKKYPTLMATSLLAADNYIRFDTNASIIPAGLSQQFGLSKALFSDRLGDQTASKTLNETLETFSRISSESATGFEAGRVPHGIESLTNTYLLSEYSAQDGEILRDRLFHSLVTFSQKVLFLGNYASLVKSDPWYKGPTSQITPSILLGEKYQGYTRVLQATGNSILVLIDQIRSQEEHAKNLLHFSPFEEKALNAVWSEPPNIIVSDFKKFLLEPGEIEITVTKKQREDLARWTEGIANEIIADGHGSKTSVIASIGARFKAALEETQKANKFLQSKGVAADDEKESMFKAGVSLVASYRSSMLASISTSQYTKDPRDTLDQLIASLRHELVRAVAEKGPTSDKAKNVTVALEIALQQRAGFIYLRPASAYLRTSFPTTFLQRDPNIKWENMLDSQASRQIPGFASLQGILSTDMASSDTLKEVDKQFWQSVNQVRVAGSGKTNYVVAKDDVGNWYVKGYEADEDKIFESAANLALFGLSAGIKTNLIKDRLSVKTTSEPITEGGTNSQQVTPSFEREFSTYSTAVKEETHKTFEEVRTFAVSLRTDDDAINPLVKRFKSRGILQDEIDKLRPALASSGNVLDNLIKITPNDGKPANSGQVIDGLRTLKEYYSILILNLAEKTDLPSHKKAQDIATRYLRSELLRLVKQQKDSLNKYETAVTILGGISNPTDK